MFASFGPRPQPGLARPLASWRSGCPRKDGSGEHDDMCITQSLSQELWRRDDKRGLHILGGPTMAKRREASWGSVNPGR